MKKLLLVLGVYSSLGISQNNLVVCQDDGFEGLNTGTLVSSAWTASYAPGQNNAGSMVYAVSYTAGSNYAQIVSTPHNDYYLGTIPASPFAGNNVALLNYGNYTERTRIGKTINVTPSNFIYRYAYRAVTGGQSPTAAGALRFNFYDCSGHLLTSLSKTVQPTTFYTSLLTNPDADYWTDSSGTTGVRTPEWIVTDVNLSAYVGSCVKVQSDINPCTCGGHLAYFYYDDMCSDKFISANPMIPKDGIPRNTLVTTSNYMSCAGTATLAGLPGFSSYSWQGPAGSSISGSTLATITTTQPGTYTLTAMTGSLSFSQEISLTLGNPLPVISGNTSVCTDDTLVLQGSGNVNTYSWNTGATTASIDIIPSAATTTAPVIYSLTTTDNLSCAITLTYSVTHKAKHPINILESINPICEGQNIDFMASASNVNVNNYTFLWSTGATSSSISVTPSAGFYVCSVAETELTGCTSVVSKTVIVHPLPQVQINATTDICTGQSANLSTQGSNIASYLWSNGSTQPSVVVSPNQTSVYTVTVTSSQHCKATSAETITVHELPQVEIIQPAHVCVGEPFNLTAQGDHMNSYLWSNGDNVQVLSDAIMGNTPFTVTVTTAYGCTSVASTYLITDPLPLLQVSADATSICEGSSVNLAAAGSTGISYSWDNGSTEETIEVSPVNTTTYVVVGTDANGCTSTVSTVITVAKCMGIEQAALNSASGLIVFPNPANSVFTIKGYKTEGGKIFNSLGQLIREFTLSSENNFSVDVSGLSKGVYFVKNGSSVISVAIN